MKGREIIRRTSLLARDILKIVGVCLGIYEEFANIAHVLSRSCAYYEAFRTFLRTNHEQNTTRDAGNVRKKFKKKIETPAELKTTPTNN